MAHTTKRTELTGIAIAAGVAAAVVGGLAFAHHDGEGAVFLGLFAVLAAMTTIGCLVILSRADAKLDEQVERDVAAFALTRTVVNPASGLPMSSAHGSFDVAGNLYGRNSAIDAANKRR